MYKNVNLLTTEGKKDFPMLANGATAIRYRQVFHEDLMANMAKFSKIETDPESVDWDLPAKLGYIMNAAAEGKDMNKLNTDNFVSWIEQFEGDTLWQSQNDIVNVYSVNQNITSNGKK